MAMGGDRTGARGAYDTFLNLWRDADPAIPFVREARQERERLQ